MLVAMTFVKINQSLKTFDFLSFLVQRVKAVPRDLLLPLDGHFR